MWINVKDRYPEEDSFVIGASDFDIYVYTMFQWSRGQWWAYGESQPEVRITRWHEIPPLPEADLHNDKINLSNEKYIGNFE